MSATQKFIRYAFGLSGTRATIPDGTQVDGTVSYETGYGVDYQRQKTDPLAKNIERDKMNQLFYDLTLGLRQYQLMGFPEYVPAADNGGAAVSYAKGAMVLYTDGLVYESLAAANTALPTDVTKWRPVVPGMTAAVPAAITASQALTVAHAGQLLILGGSGGTITLPALSAVPAGYTVTLLSGTNAGTWTIQRAGTDLIAPNSSTATSIALGNGDAVTLVAGGAGSFWRPVAGSAQVASSSTAFGAASVWTDVKASRAINTNYTNTTGRPMMVMAGGTATGATGYYTLVIGGVVAAQQNVAAGLAFALVGIVPPGGVYSLNKGGADTFGTLVWSELK